MATRYPLIVDTTDDNKIKELPSGDNLNLSGNNIVNVVAVTANGTITANAMVVDTSAFTVNGQSLNTVAFTGSYTDLSNTPTPFSGSYTDLTDKPTIKTTIESLDNVGSTAPTNGQALLYNSSLGRYEPATLSFASSSQGTLADNALQAGMNVSLLNNDAGYITASQDSQTLSYSNGQLTISNGNSVTISNIDITGSVFADNSTLLVDGVSGTIPAENLAGNIILDSNLISNGNRITHAASGTVSMLDFTLTQFGQTNNTVLSSVKSINLFLDSNGGDSGQAFRIYNDTNPDSSPTENTYIFKVSENGDTNITGKLLLPDGSVSANYAGFGADDDLKIFHNGNHSIVRETGTGNLYLQSNDNVILSKDSDTEIMVKAIADGAVELYHNAVKKFETTANGIAVEGSVTSNFIGSVFADDSTLLVDGVSGTIPGYISIAVLKAEVAASADFAAFKVRIAAL